MSGIIAPIVGLPGVRAAKTALHKVVFKGGITGFLPGGKLLSGTYSRDPTNIGLETVLQAGLILGKRSADSLYAPSILGTNTVAVAAAATSITALAGTVTELVRRIGASGTFKLTGPPTAGGGVVTETITYSAASGTTITCTATVNAFIGGSFIQPTDGSETPITPIPDGWGIPVAGIDGVVQATIQLPLVPTDGMIDVTQVVNYPTDAALIAWLQARLNDRNGGQFVFSDRY